MKKNLFQKTIFLLVLCILMLSPVYTQSLADSPWPKYQGPDLHNRGRSSHAGTDTPEVKWIFEMGSDTRCKNVSIGPDGIIYVGSATKLYALNPDGTIKWSTDMNYPGHVTVANDGFLLVGTVNCSNDRMYKVNAANGSIIWAYDLSIFSTCGLYPSTLASDGTVIFGIGGSSTRYLFALNPNGTGRWSVAFDDNVETLPTLTHDGNYIIAGNNLNLLYKVDLNTGDIVDSTTPPGGKYIYGHVTIDENGNMYLTSATYGTPYIYKYNSDMVLQWKRSVGSYHYVVPPSIGYDGLIYTGGTTTNKLFAFKSNGDVKWEFVLDGGFTAPPVIDTNHTVYVVTRNFLYAIDPTVVPTTLKWKFPSEGNLGGKGYPQPAIAEDGTIYLLTRDGILYALGSKNNPPVAVCKSIEISADENCQSTITAEDVDNGSYDPDEGDEITLSIDNEGPFSPGVYTIILTVTDTYDESDTCIATVTVKDTTTPVPNLTELPTITGECSVKITTIPKATDNCAWQIQGSTTDPLEYNQQGEYIVTWTYDDGNGNTAYQEQTALVKDTTVPVVDGLTASPNVLWPPNHKMVEVTVSADVTDNCDSNPTAKIVSITSNEPIDETGDGNTSPDWEITGDLTVNLRAERSGNGDGRIYTIKVKFTDVNGNGTTQDVLVTVPKNKSKK